MTKAVSKTSTKSPSYMQSMWLREYARTGNGYQSALTAGYSKGSASNWRLGIAKSTAVKDLMTAIGLDGITIAKELKTIVKATPKTPLKYSDKLNAIKIASTIRGDIGQDNKQGAPVVNVVANYYDKDDEPSQSIKLKIDPIAPAHHKHKPEPQKPENSTPHDK